jgi:hypothetical protein
MSVFSDALSALENLQKLSIQYASGTRYFTSDTLCGRRFRLHTLEHDWYTFSSDWWTFLSEQSDIRHWSLDDSALTIAQVLLEKEILPSLISVILPSSALISLLPPRRIQYLSVLKSPSAGRRTFDSLGGVSGTLTRLSLITTGGPQLFMATTELLDAVRKGAPNLIFLALEGHFTVNTLPSSPTSEY